MHFPISKSHAHFCPIFQINGVYNANDSYNIDTPLQPMLETPNFNVSSSVPCKHLLHKQSSATTSYFQLDNLLFDNEMITSKNLLNYLNIGHYQNNTLFLHHWVSNTTNQYSFIFPICLTTKLLD